MPSSPDFYYSAKGEKVPLQRVPGAYVVRFTRGARSDSAALSAPSRRWLREESAHVDFLPHYGLQVYRTVPRATPAAAAAATPRGGKARAAQAAAAAPQGDDRVLRTLQDEPVVDVAAPVFRHPGGKDPVFITNRFVVEFKPGVTEAQAADLNTAHGVRIVEPLGYSLEGPGYVLEAPPEAGPTGAIELSNRYFESGLVRYAQPDLIRKRAFRPVADATAPTGDEIGAAGNFDWHYESEQWHLARAKVVDAWVHGEGNANITVCIADDGVDVAHPAFAGRIAGQYDFEADFADATPKTELDNHGTACAGVAIAAGADVRGAAPGCKVLAVRTPAYLGAVDEGRMFQWIADNNADVLSCSWGPPDGEGDYPLADNVASAIHYCVTRGRGGKGIPILWAAGNGNELMSGDGYAANPEVIAVAASTEQDTKAYYSDFGPAICVCAPSSGRKADNHRKIWTVDRLGAAGYNIGDITKGDAEGLYTNGFGGTSAAAPLAAGVAALVLSANPNLRWNEVRQILANTAEKIGPAGEYDASGHSVNFGFGRIDAARAVAQARTGQVPAEPETPATVQEPANAHIEGPATAIRTGEPPGFVCGGGANSHFAIEVATDAQLFDRAQHGGERHTDNFYATWQDGGFLTGAAYALPQAVWDRLNAAERIYYRLISSASSSGWSNVLSTTPDSQAANAPFIQVVEADGIEPPTAETMPFIQGPVSVGRCGPAPTFSAGPDPMPYAIEVTTDAKLFDAARHGSARTPSNYYATWQDSGLLTAPAYTLPAAIWDALKPAARLYYRLTSSESATSWLRPRTTTSNAEALSAPYSTITDAQGAPCASRFRAARSADEGDGATTARAAAPPASPVVTGPETYDRAAPTGPAFLLMPGTATSCALEVVTDPLLFEPAAGDALRTPENFFASWSDRLLETAGTVDGATTFTLPPGAWQALANSERLYYRILTTSDSVTWTNVRRSYPDAQGSPAPFIELKGRSGARTEEDGRHRPEENLWRDES